jgi:epoxyqueuosine reductase
MYINESGGCHQCWGTCTFNVNSGASIHEVIKGTVATTPLLNGFFFNMAENFGYGDSDQKAEDWWDLSLPVCGIDTSRVAYHGGYRKGL